MRTFLTASLFTALASSAMAHSMDMPAPPRPDMIPFLAGDMPGLAEQQSTDCSLMLDENVGSEGLNCIIVGTRDTLRNLDATQHVVIVVGDGAQDIMEKFGIWSTETVADIAD